jgi:PAS domain S-box-containing protein
VLVSENVAITGTYEYGEVARSVLIAIAASYTALDLAGRVTAARGRVRLAWLSGGAVAMGIGICEMHLKGMLAFRLPVPVQYHWPTALIALSVAILASAVALYVTSRQKMGRLEALIGSIVMGAGIAGLHYTLMGAMRMPAITQYSPILVTCSLLLAILFSLIALLTAFGLREETRWGIGRRVGSAVVMGIAISAMHYTGMAAAGFYSAPPPDLSHTVNVTPFGSYGVFTATLIVLLAAVITSSMDRRASAEIQRLNQELERRVTERTAQLEAINQSLRKEIVERERAEDAVRRSEEHLRLVIDTIPQQIMSGPNDGTLDFANAQWRAYTGLTQAGLQGRGWQRIIHPDDRERLLKAVEESRAQGRPYEEEVRRRSADGQYRWFLARGVPLKDPEGRIVRWYGSNTDIQDRKEAENRIRLVIDTAPAMLHSARPDGYVDFFNKRWLEYVGASLQEISGWQWTHVLHPDDVQDVLRKWRSSIATGTPLEAEARFRRADGEYRLMLLRKVPLRAEAGGIVKWYGSATDIEDRKRAEDELRKQKELFQKIFENIPVMIAFFGVDGRIELVNPEWERVIGWTLQEIRERDPDIFAELYPDPQDRQMAQDFALSSTGGRGEFKVRVRDGRVIDMAARVVQLSDGSTLGIGRDITERKRADEALRASEREQHKIAEQLKTERARLIEAQAVAEVGSWETELPSLDTTWSEQVHRIFETDPSYFRPTRPGFVEFVHPEDRAKVDAAFEDSLEKRTPSTVEYRIVMADGRVKVLEEHWEVFHDGQGRPTRLIGTCQDITRRKRMEEALRESEARFRLVSDSAPVMIWMSGTDKLCTYFNKPWLDFAGRSIDQELGNGWTDGVDSEDLQRCLDTYIQAFDRREAFRMEYRLRRHDGEYRWVSDIGVPRFNPDGSFAGYIGSCIDITEQKRAEEQLRHAQEDLARVTRVVAMGELAAAIAHEVNQPLTAIVTNANFSLRQLEDAIPHPGELRAAITEIVSDGTRASAVISRIRGLLAKATPRTTDLDINQIIQEVNILMHNEFTRNHVLLRTDLAADLPLVPGDAVELQQVLINLIMNAIEALRTSTDGRREILIRSAQNPDGVLIQVQDSGPGIAPEVADRIFEPFFTTKPEGIGMGLAISRSIVESHGGNLWAESSYNGALIQFTLPSK